MGTLILSGGGSIEQNAETNRYFVESIDKDKPLLYIPLAGDPQYRSYESSLAYVQSMFLSLGIREITLWSDLENKTIEEVKQFSAIYFSGGYTLTLLKAIRKSGFDEVLTQFYESGGTIYGQSAGAIIFGSNISHTLLKEDTSFDYAPLNLLNHYRLWCHYDSTDDELICELSKENDSPFIALTEGGAICFSNSNVKVLSKTVYKFKDCKKKNI
ncbi:Type 1 glutamine amidotransferase-like domain-containing protein [Pseudalkalibacillus hwajinpoensis]|uniref:Peptidase E n=1 Tax=Guptibacillus hwajinpoensis TaxID=208199 RepID=A0A4U1MHR3_9BACL|nr:Type 1 glutamine amidotransferase-like domain-containing protein [Pseudalkalibacillus hwajinpoensis]TKD69976.1 peptidase E [Pseudalkalibacillus hwajinpoensis]